MRDSEDEPCLKQGFCRSSESERSDSEPSMFVLEARIVPENEIMAWNTSKQLGFVKVLQVPLTAAQRGQWCRLEVAEAEVIDRRAFI